MTDCPLGGAVKDCPLYWLAHKGTKGCVDDMAQPCRVERGEMPAMSRPAALLLYVANEMSRDNS